MFEGLLKGQQYNWKQNKDTVQLHQKLSVSLSTQMGERLKY